MKEISSGKRFLIAIAVMVVFFLFINVRQLFDHTGGKRSLEFDYYRPFKSENFQVQGLIPNSWHISEFTGKTILSTDDSIVSFSSGDSVISIYKYEKYYYEAELEKVIFNTIELSPGRIEYPLVPETLDPKTLKEPFFYSYSYRDVLHIFGNERHCNLYIRENEEDFFAIKACSSSKDFEYMQPIFDKIVESLRFD